MAGLSVLVGYLIACLTELPRFPAFQEAYDADINIYLAILMAAGIAIFSFLILFLLAQSDYLCRKFSWRPILISYISLLLLCQVIWAFYLLSYRNVGWTIVPDRIDYIATFKSFITAQIAALMVTLFSSFLRLGRRDPVNIHENLAVVLDALERLFEDSREENGSSTTNSITETSLKQLRETVKRVKPNLLSNDEDKIANGVIESCEILEQRICDLPKEGRHKISKDKEAKVAYAFLRGAC